MGLSPWMGTCFISATLVTQDGHHWPIPFFDLVSESLLILDKNDLRPSHIDQMLRTFILYCQRSLWKSGDSPHWAYICGISPLWWLYTPPNTLSNYSIVIWLCVCNCWWTICYWRTHWNLSLCASSRHWRNILYANDHSWPGHCVAQLQLIFHMVSPRGLTQHISNIFLTYTQCFDVVPQLNPKYSSHAGCHDHTLIALGVLRKGYNIMWWSYR